MRKKKGYKKTGSYNFEKTNKEDDYISSQVYILLYYILLLTRNIQN